jgi:hypothetical protein
MEVFLEGRPDAMRRKNHWPDYLFTVAVRIFFGVLYGAGAGLLAGFSVVWGIYWHAQHVGAQMIWHWGKDYTTERLMWWFAAWCVLGAAIAVWRIPDWQRPWSEHLARTNMAWRKVEVDRGWLQFSFGKQKRRGQKTSP